MGQKDLTEKNFIMYPDIYADILNALAYAGSRVVHAEALIPAPTESFYYVGRGRLSNQFSDVSMYEMKEGRIRTQYILENEVKAKPRTIFRKAGYEGALYRRQIEDSQTYPIISLLLYWGESPWQHPSSIRGYFQDADIEAGSWKYITNEKLHIYSMMHLPKRIRNRFHSDMRMVLDFLAEGKNYQPTDQKIIHLESFMLMLGALTKDNRYLHLLKSVQEEEREKGGITMCELLDKYWNSGIETGMKRGMKQGMRQGIDQGEARLSSLNEKLFNLNRIDDIRKAASSKRYRNQLYKEFGII